MSVHVNGDVVQRLKGDEAYRRPETSRPHRRRNTANPETIVDWPVVMLYHIDDQFASVIQKMKT